MFLEETIESLDTEEDSGLSNDEPEQLSNPGNLATILADLSASMSKSKLNGKLISADRCRVSLHLVNRLIVSLVTNMCFFVFQAHQYLPLRNQSRKRLTPNPCRVTWFLHLLSWQAAILALHSMLNQTRTSPLSQRSLLRPTNLVTSTTRNLLEYH